MKPAGRRIFLFGIGAAVVLVASAFTLPPAKWRSQIVIKKASGDFDEIGWGELLQMLGPRSAHSLQPLLENNSVYLTIRNPHNKSADIKRGAASYAERCASCHGPKGQGGSAPSVVDGELRHGASDWAVFKVVKDGVPGTAMVPQSLPEEDIWRLVAFVQDQRASLREDAQPDARAASSEFDTYQAITDADLRAKGDVDDWVTYSGSYDGHRFRAHTQINTDNVGRLAARWVFQPPGRTETLQATPLVRDGVMYFTGSLNEVFALNAATGNLLWTYRHRMPKDVTTCCGPVNRGVAVVGDRVFMGTQDARLVALDARTGAVKWNVAVADFRDGYAITGAPLVVADQVITGVSGSAFGIRGFVAAFDAATGERKWQFNTIPAPGEKYHDSWAGDSWKRGGGATWLTGSYDPELDLLYWGVGNPAPLFSGDVRSGDNLYTNSVLALDPETGTLRWHFQFTPHDVHDWDAVQIPVLVDYVNAQGVTEPRMIWANKNGFFYVLDRRTGRFIHGTPFVKQTWAEGLAANGRPILSRAGAATAKGALVFPGVGGGTNWWSPAFNAALDLFYVMTLESAGVYYENGSSYKPGERYLSGAGTGTTGSWFAIRALNPRTGGKVWEYIPNPRQAPRAGGLLTTAGNIVVGAHGSAVFALDARSGGELWKMQVGGVAAAAPISYMVDGRQYIAVAAGRTLVAFTLPDSPNPDRTR